MINENFIYVGFILSFFGGLSYLIDTVKGKIQPNKVSWFLWSLAPLIAFLAEIHQGVGLQALLTFSVGFNPLLIFIASFFNKKATWKLTRFDIFCGILSLAGIIAWYITRVGDIAIIFAIFADALAGVPTIIKAFKEPETENYKVFMLGSINSTITLLTIKKWQFAQYGFPVYILLICVLLFILIKFKIGKRFISKSAKHQ